MALPPLIEVTIARPRPPCAIIAAAASPVQPTWRHSAPRTQATYSLPAAAVPLERPRRAPPDLRAPAAGDPVPLLQLLPAPCAHRGDPAPLAGYFWVSGSWQWNGAEWLWQPGHYEPDPSYSGDYYTPSYDAGYYYGQ